MTGVQTCALPICVVAKDGQRLLSLSSVRSAIFVIEWDVKTQTLAKQDYQTVYL